MTVPLPGVISSSSWSSRTSSSSRSAPCLSSSRCTLHCRHLAVTLPCTGHFFQQVQRTVALVNRSRRAIDVSLLDAAAALAPKSVLLSFGGGALEGEMRPRETRTLEVRFAPAARIRPFSEPVVVTVCGLPRPLLVCSGACVAMDLQLEMDQVAFGQAVLNSRITRRLMLQNLGDMPSRFHVQGAFAPDFSVSPLEGFLQPNEVKGDLTPCDTPSLRPLRYTTARTAPPRNAPSPRPLTTPLTTPLTAPPHTAPLTLHASLRASPHA